MRAGSVDPGYFVDLYRRESDPWKFASSPYERDKYAASLAVLQPHYERALEIACSVGVFTRLLARRCGSLLAIDPSPEAVECARKRCAHLHGVTTRCGAVPDDYPEGMFDLVTFCEVGFYLVHDDLIETRDRIVASLRAGGQTLLVHWTPPVQGHAASAAEVHQAFALHPELRAVAHRDAPTYTLDLFGKVTGM
ncbi:MAG: class I SAM-dependent methyltransferase [Candidatus Eremiobacteraeota bacterium]|nr:class I SAM-dependent methyltransferase [Candidatus Eremiobacteraeota bacterium]